MALYSCFLRHHNHNNEAKYNTKKCNLERFSVNSFFTVVIICHFYEITFDAYFQVFICRQTQYATQAQLLQSFRRQQMTNPGILLVKVRLSLPQASFKHVKALSYFQRKKNPFHVIHLLYKKKLYIRSIRSSEWFCF